MTDKEFETIALAIKAAYPSASILPDKYAMKTWFELLQDLEYCVVQNAVMEHISTSVFPPSIAEIREKCSERLTPMITDWGDAWDEVQRAIRYFGSYREPEAMESLSNLTAAAVKRMGFRNLCVSDNQMADRAHFQRIYESLVKREKSKQQLPQIIRKNKEKMIMSHRPSGGAAIEKKQETKEKNGQGDYEASEEYIHTLMSRFRGNL